MLDRLRNISGKVPYHGAGILFACKGASGWRVLLFHRAVEPDFGKWSTVGGRCNLGEAYRDGAFREASEEAFGERSVVAVLQGYLADGFTPDQAREQVQYNIPLIFEWRTYLLELSRKAPVELFTLNWENKAVRWFGVSELPSETHFGVLSSLEHFGLLAKSKRTT
jgi:ADP-ribose pyrophosphatase YjhB (NUDIX family)